MSAAGSELTVARCMCGRELGELREKSGQVPRGTFSLPCSRCRDVIRDYWFDKQVPRRRLLVVQTIDLQTGEVLPEEVDIIQDHERGNRVGDRGGIRLPPSVLTESLRRMRRRLQAGRQ